MGMKRRLERVQRKTKAQKHGKVRVQGQEINLDEVPEEIKAVALFRQAAEYQQMVSEVYSHATSAMESLDPDDDHYDYFLDAVTQLREHYNDAKRHVSERGMEMIALLDITEKEDGNIIIPDLDQTILHPRDA